MKRLTQEEALKKAISIHGNKFIYDKFVYISHQTKSIIICRLHGEFSQTPNNHFKGKGCMECKCIKFSDEYSFSQEKCIEKFRSAHGDKYGYDNVAYECSKKEVKIYCFIHKKIFCQLPILHWRGAGCPACGIIKRAKNYTYSLEEWIDKCNLVHKFKYDYSKSNHTKLKKYSIIICKIHGEFKQLAQAHMQGQGCPICGDIRCGDKRRKTKEQFTQEAIVVHGDKYSYKYFVYINTDTKGKIYCNNCNSTFEQRPYSHISGNGCPKCNGINRTSSVENQWLDYLGIAENNRQIILKIPGKKYIMADAYIKETNTIYEFYGDYWHGNPSRYNPNHINKFNKKIFKVLYDETIQREKNIKDAGYNLITIWEKDWNKQKRMKEHKT